MGILAITGLTILLIAIFGPQYWVQYVISKHDAPRLDFPGTGGELAEHLVQDLELSGVKVQSTDKGDYYDPQAKTVCLLKNHHEGKSITAVAIAAHEVGHAIQDNRGEKLLSLRQRLVGFASITDKFASIFFLAAPILSILAKTPVAFLGIILIGIALLGIRLIAHLVTLPLEWDASFAKALPILEQGGYLSPRDMPAARQVLKAAALTYVAATLASLLNIARWVRILR